jgi:hypothetical protein
MKQVWICKKCGAENEPDRLELTEPQNEQHPAKPLTKSPLYGVAALGVVGLAQIEPVVKLVMIVVISLAVLGVSLFILVSRKYKGEKVRWAVSGITAVTSFWLGRIS